MTLLVKSSPQKLSFQIILGVALLLLTNFASVEVQGFSLYNTRSLSRRVKSSFRYEVDAESSRLWESQSGEASGTTSGVDGSTISVRFPTSVEDQVRMAAVALKAASKDSDPGVQQQRRHAMRLLLPVIGATELDDWPGGARQMMEAAAPMVTQMMLTWYKSRGKEIEAMEESVIDTSDGVRAIFIRAKIDPKDDAIVVLLPSGDTFNTLESLEAQVGSKRNMILINCQWKRPSDFPTKESAEFVTQFAPTFHCSNLMVEGDQIRILRTYPGDWRVFLMVQDDANQIDWIEIGTKPLVEPSTVAANNIIRDGTLFNYGQPNYREIESMITSRDDYVPKSAMERAQAAFTFIKDTL
jgi:hypothetical protein